jgi:hypothetical protein
VEAPKSGVGCCDGAATMWNGAAVVVPDGGEAARHDRWGCNFFIGITTKFVVGGDVVLPSKDESRWGDRGALAPLQQLIAPAERSLRCRVDCYSGGARCADL